MAKNKGFRDWYNEYQDQSFREEESPEAKFKKKDGKRYDKKKAAIQKARRQKNKQRNSFFS